MDAILIHGMGRTPAARGFAHRRLVRLLMGDVAKMCCAPKPHGDKPPCYAYEACFAGSAISV